MAKKSFPQHRCEQKRSKPDQLSPLYRQRLKLKKHKRRPNMQTHTLKKGKPHIFVVKNNKLNTKIKKGMTFFFTKLVTSFSL